MHDIWGGVKDLPNAMATEISDDGKTLAFRITLNRMTDVTERRTWTYRFNAFHHGGVSHFDQPAGFYFDITDEEHSAGIAKP